MKTQPTYRLLFWLLALTGLAADQASKYSIFAWLRDEPRQEHQSTPGFTEAHAPLADSRDVPRHERRIIPGVFHLVAQHEVGEDGQLVPYVNRGALFGWMGSLGVKANSGFALISLIAAIAIIIWVAQRETAADRWLCVALGLILGGTLGNLYDRMAFGGVRDFLHWKMPDWPVFNLADCCLVIGAGLLLVQAFRTQPQAENTTSKASLRVLPTEPQTVTAKAE
jgi:signal peptidase II